MVQHFILHFKNIEISDKQCHEKISLTPTQWNNLKDGVMEILVLKSARSVLTSIIR